MIVVAESGTRFPADLVILAIGVRPETGLAKAAGLRSALAAASSSTRRCELPIRNLGCRRRRRSARRAHGSGNRAAAGRPGESPGRVAAESIAGRATQFRGVQATAVVGVLGLTVASTGASEKGLRRAGVTTLEGLPASGPPCGLLPGRPADSSQAPVLRPDGRILGAQAIGLEGVEKRIDVIATAIQFRGTVHDLAEAELCYAPQFGAAKDPVNLAGMLAENVLNGDMPVADWLELDAPTRCCSTCASPTNSPPGTFPTRSTCRCRSCAPVTPSCRRIARSGSLRRRTARVLATVSWRSTDIDRICLEGIRRIRHSGPSAWRGERRRPAKIMILIAALKIVTATLVVVGVIVSCLDIK